MMEPKDSIETMIDNGFARVKFSLALKSIRVVNQYLREVTKEELYDIAEKLGQLIKYQAHILVDKRDVSSFINMCSDEMLTGIIIRAFELDKIRKENEKNKD